MAETDLKHKTVNAVLWNTLEKILVKGASFFISIVLARILSPSDYGLIGMLTIFISLSSVFIESGFARALIQKQDCTDVDYSTAFYSNLGVAILLYILLFFSAPLVADFYNEPLLCDILRILSINFVIGSLNIVQRAKLMSSMNFKALAKINFYSVLAGGALGIAMAYSDWGVWALVGQTLASTLLMVFLFPHYSRWIPIKSFSVQSFHTLFGFGSKLLLTGTVATIVNNITTIAIGKAYRSDQLGYYTRAVHFSDTIAWTINDVMGTVTFPVLSKLQNDRERLVSTYRKSLFYTAFIIFPIMILVALLAKPIIVVLLTEKWLPSVVLLQILCMARMFTPLSAINMNLLNAIGRSDLFMRIDLVKIPLILVALAIAIPMGVKAVVIGNLITTIISFFINTYYPGKMYGYGAWEQIKDYRMIFLSVLLMAIATIAILALFDNYLVQLIFGALVGTLVYLSSSILFKAITIQEIKSLFQRKRQ